MTSKDIKEDAFFNSRTTIFCERNWIFRPCLKLLLAPFNTALKNYYQLLLSCNNLAKSCPSSISALLTITYFKKALVALPTFCFHYEIFIRRLYSKSYSIFFRKKLLMCVFVALLEELWLLIIWYSKNHQRKKKYVTGLNFLCPNLKVFYFTVV